MERCGKKGVRYAIVVSGGFNEVGGDGQALQERLEKTAGQYGIRFLGPNCIGVVNPYADLNTTFFQYGADPGFIGMASQSGSFITQMFDYLQQLGLGFSTGISVGNEADIDIVDCMEYLAECPHTRVIALYIEGIRRGRHFIDTARKIVPHKPIVAYYVGGSEAGRRAGFSHTGALAGPDRLYDGVFRQSGIIRAYSIEELFDFCTVLGLCPLPQGNRVVVQTHSGGPGAAAADAAGRAGLEMPLLSAETLEKLKPFIPPTASAANPVDMTFSKNPLDYFTEIPGILINEQQADGLLVYFVVPHRTVQRALEGMGISPEQAPEQARMLMDTQCEAVAALSRKQKKPVIGFTFRTNQDPLIRGLRTRGVPVLPSSERGAWAMGALVRYARFKERLLGNDTEQD
jgi:acyl-CoA synthetase (NDP forming)